jgi:hypothetical protein
MAIYYEMHYSKKENRVVINEDKLDDDTIKRFLVSMNGVMTLRIH